VDPKDRQCHVRLAVFALDEGAVSACLDAESVRGKPLAERRRGGLSSLNSVSRLAVGCERPRTQVHRQGCARHPGLDAALASDWAGTARHTIEFEASEKITGESQCQFPPAAPAAWVWRRKLLGRGLCFGAVGRPDGE